MHVSVPIWQVVVESMGPPCAAYTGLDGEVAAMQRVCEAHGSACSGFSFATDRNSPSVYSAEGGVSGRGNIPIDRMGGSFIPVASPRVPVARVACTCTCAR